MKNNSLEFKVLQLTSGHFLCKTIPDDWNELTEGEQNEFLIQNVWGPLENLDVSFLWETIENSATITQRFIENLKGENK